ncbi:unnamed protein product [Candidula unifasciata]|uniref:Glutamate receptor ionotropic, NMDA 2B n=1 Tax=Candidula unifasciata TaxID=100452 RepID=A0A8S3ZR40_9EUPU|nr:unnamed protein product [Candidula unifasciata]
MSKRPAGYSTSPLPSSLGIAPLLLFIILVNTSTTSYGEPIKVRIHAIIPSHFAMTTELSREFHNAMLNFRRDSRNHKFRSLFNPEGDITFVTDDTPREIMDAFCKGILAKQVTTILNINNPLGIRRRTSSNEYIVELAGYLGIPMISWDSQYSGSSQTEKILQLAPTIEHQASAIVSLLERYNWTSFSIITSQVGGDAQFVAVVESLVEMRGRKTAGIGGEVKADSLEILSTLHIRHLDDVRPMLEKLVGTDTRVFLLHSSSRASYDIIETASKLGLTGKDYVWILTRSSIPIGKFGTDSFPVGLLGISFEYDLDAMKRAVRAGVKTWLQAMLDLFNEPHVEFNENGTLKNTELLVVNLQWHDSQREKTEWVEVGRWVGRGLIMRDITWPGESSIPPTGKPKRAFLRVATLNELPYVIYRLPREDGQCEENALPCRVYQRDTNKNLISNMTVGRCCVGLSMDLLKIFSTQLNFDFVLTEVEDGKWGSINKETKTWNGLVKALLDNKADVVMTAMKINPERAETGIKIIVALREGAISPTAFLEPYDYASWSFILIFSVHATGASILIFEWLSPYGLNMGQTPKREHRFSLFRSFWLIWSMLFSTSVRFLANIWALFALVFLASYTANLAAFMITKEEFYDLSGIKDHRLQNPYTMNPPFKYATVPNGSTEANIRANHKDMYNYMKPYNQPDVDAGIAALKTGKIQAFIYDSSVLEYYASRDPQCRLVTVGNRYAMTGYGVGFQPSLPSHWIDKFNRVILRLQETGELDRLQKFWLAGACKSTKEANLSNRTLGIINFTSAFILLGSGILLGLVILCLEHLYFIFWRKYLRVLDKCDCCSLVSLSMGKSLQLYDEDSLYEDGRGHCKDPHCERQTWKLRYQLDMALLKINNLQHNLRNNRISTVCRDTYFGDTSLSYTDIISGNGNCHSENWNSLCDNGKSLCDNGNSVCDNILTCYDSCSYQSPVHKLRRTPSYTSAIGGSMNSDLTGVTPTHGPAKFGHLDDSRYSVVSSSNALT